MSRQFKHPWLAITWLALASAVAVVCSACSEPPRRPARAEAKNSAKASSDWQARTSYKPAAGTASQPQLERLTVKEPDVWEEAYLHGAKIGHNHVSIRPVQLDGRPLLQVVVESSWKLLRFGMMIDQVWTTSTLETPEGTVVEFWTQVGDQTSSQHAVKGRVREGEMHIETATTGTPRKSTRAWSDEIGGFRAIEQSLERRPMQPGEKRHLKMLTAQDQQVADVDLVAVSLESTRALDRSQRLLRVETTSRLPDGKETVVTLWTDEAGRALKSRDEHSQEETYRSTRETAIFTGQRTLFDIGNDVMVKLPRPLRHGHGSRQVRYKVELEDADPAALFSTGLTQSVRSLDEHTAEVTVRSVLPNRKTRATSSGSVDPQYLSANHVLETEDTEIRAMAKQAQGGQTKPREIVLNLERYVKRAIIHKDYSQGFATAAEVARSRRGDCTEHSVLLAALARVCGIPSRVAMGLVYIESQGGFGYHMWNELLLDDQWIPFDATLAFGGIGAAHLKLADSSLDGPAAHTVYTAGARVVGHLKIEVLQAE